MSTISHSAALNIRYFITRSQIIYPATQSRAVWGWFGSRRRTAISSKRFVSGRKLTMFPRVIPRTQLLYLYNRMSIFPRLTWGRANSRWLIVFAVSSSARSDVIFIAVWRRTLYVPSSWWLGKHCSSIMVYLMIRNMIMIRNRGELSVLKHGVYSNI